MQQFPHPNTPQEKARPRSRLGEYATHHSASAIANRADAVSFKSQLPFATCEGMTAHASSKPTATGNAAATDLDGTDNDRGGSDVADWDTNYHRRDSGPDEFATVLQWASGRLIVVNNELTLSALIAMAEAAWIGGVL